MTAQVIHGDCMDVLAGMAANSVDAIVTDPPYEIGFMGKGWDGSGIAYRVELWAECLRVLKPGGHLLAFGGTRTYHRMTVAIEDAGFEIRDSLHWCYGSGFPKSLDVSKAIDKMDAAEEQEKRRLRFTAWVRSTGLTSKQIDDATSTNMGGHYTTAASQPAIMTREHLDAVRHLIKSVPAWVERECDIRSVESRNFAEREVVGKRDVPIGHSFAGPTYGGDARLVVDVTAPATDAARQWSGWGTALKPAHEPIVVARKPLVGTVAGNVLTHSTGALNIDGCRVLAPPSESFEGLVGRPIQKLATRRDGESDEDYKARVLSSPGQQEALRKLKQMGRWPANLVFTHTHNCADRCAPGCPVAELDRQSGDRPGMKPGILRRGATTGTSIGGGSALGVAHPQDVDAGYGDSGGASRFFTVTEWDPTADVPPFRYVAKPSKRERNAGLDGLPERSAAERYQTISTLNAEHQQRLPAANHHPTVKPVALMRWLVRLVTPPGGTVLDPFAGSGTTLVAATLEGFHAIGIELTDDYHPIIAGRIAWAETQAAAPPDTLFDPRTATA